MTKMHNIFRIFRMTLGCVLVIAIVVSIIISQVSAPTHFTSLGQQKDPLTAFLRAAVKMGDTYLIKQVFPDSLIAEYPVVFHAYLQESDWVTRLRSIEARSPQSRDVLAALAILEDHLGNQAKAQEYRDKIRSIDPVYEMGKQK